jgi:enediyne biosynthesis protein E4
MSDFRPATELPPRRQEDARAAIWPGSLGHGILFLCLLAVGCGPHSAPKSPPANASTNAINQSVPDSGSVQEGAIRFADASARWFGGPEHAPVYRNGEESGHCAILESLGGGVGLLDFDRDGWLDMVFPGGGNFAKDRSIRPLPTRLWRGGAGLSAREVTAASHVPGAAVYSHGVAVGDYNDDGFPDVVVTGYGGLSVWHNQGDGTWRDATASSGLGADLLWSTSAAWGDVDGDGNVDLYVAHYVNWSFDNHPHCANIRNERDVCPPRQFQPLPDTLFSGVGDGSFVDASERMGLRRDGKGLGVVLADLDGDRRLDAYVTNDTTANFLYHHAEPSESARWTEVGMASGTALSDMGTPDGSMGVSVGDFDNDGLPDLWVANYEREIFALYRNLGKCLFQHVSQATGIAATGGSYVGFGTTFGDWDLDGDEDLVVVNGHISHVPAGSPVRQTPLLLENQGGTRFVNRTESAGEFFRTPRVGRGLACGDLDHDGDADLVATATGDGAAVLENRSARVGDWLRVEILAISTPRVANGARLTLETSLGPRVRHVVSGGSYLSASEGAVWWGVPAGSKDLKLTIDWPGGATKTIAIPESNRRWIVREGCEPLTIGGRP